METRERIKALCGGNLPPVINPWQWREHKDELAKADVVFGTWRMPAFDPEYLETAKRLKAVFYAAGSIKPFVNPDFWSRNIPISSGWQSLGIGVAEYAFALILLSLKRFFLCVNSAIGSHEILVGKYRQPGTYKGRVGLISLGAIGRDTLRLLRNTHIEVWAYEPFIAEAEAKELGVTVLTSSLEEIFAHCDVVSLHAPWIPETEGMVTGKLVSLMPEGATLINTARGAIVNEAEVCEVLAARSDITAHLDVTHPEPAAPDSPLRTLPNVFLTPHIAGAAQNDCRILSDWMVEEFERFLKDEPLKYTLTAEKVAKMT